MAEPILSKSAARTDPLYKRRSPREANVRPTHLIKSALHSLARSIYAVLEVLDVPRMSDKFRSKGGRR
jgi:hypothetical protein